MSGVPGSLTLPSSLEIGPVRNYLSSKFTILSFPLGPQKFAPICSSQEGAKLQQEEGKVEALSQLLVFPLMNPLIYLVERKNLAFNTQLHKSTERKVSDEYHSLSWGFLKLVSAMKMHKVQDSRILFSYIRSHKKKIKKKIRGALKTPVLVPGLQVAEFYCCYFRLPLKLKLWLYLYSWHSAFSNLSTFTEMWAMNCSLHPKKPKKGLFLFPSPPSEGEYPCPKSVLPNTPVSSLIYWPRHPLTARRTSTTCHRRVSVAPNLTLSLYFTFLMHKLVPSKGLEALGTSPADAPVWWELPHPAVRLYSYKRLQHRLKGF